jgi:hypothetical protein
MNHNNIKNQLNRLKPNICVEGFEAVQAIVKELGYKEPAEEKLRMPKANEIWIDKQDLIINDFSMIFIFDEDGTRFRCAHWKAREPNVDFNTSGFRDYMNNGRYIHFADNMKEAIEKILKAKKNG